MKKTQFQIGAIAGVGLLMVLCSRAQDIPADTFSDTASADELERKEPGFWHGPKRDTPALQLAYARELAEAGRTRKAAREFNDLVHEWHDTPEAVSAQRAYANMLEDRGKYVKAFNEFQYLMEFYSGKFDYADVLDHQFQIANAVMNERHGRFLLMGGFKSPERALPLFQQVAKNGPTWSRAPETQFLIGWILEEDKQLEAAIQAYDNLRQRWPHDELAVSAAYGGTRCLVQIADSNARDEVSCRRALVALAGFIRDYADDPNVAEATKERDRLSTRLAGMHYERAAYYDKIAKRPESALIAYADFLREFPYALQAEAVNTRMRELQAMLSSQEASP